MSQDDANRLREPNEDEVGRQREPADVEAHRLREPAEAEPGKTREGLSLAVTATPAQIFAGQETTVVVSLTNPTSGSVTLEFPTSCQIVFTVETESGATLYPEGGSAICAQVLKKK